ncbi:hypothetical protein [uncultured Mucilaginibacter sp.]|uniref:hypothetical protein n=1 Tax=uncultured Mucilaginibacter sp. TaxID=797541 RepID=UPI0025F030E4|nr:hypothetical protein [uncultured Mucilaginibacter sp.]
MDNLPLLSIFHTFVAVLAILMAFYGLFRSGRINPTSDVGRLYTLFTVVSCLSSLPIMKTGHPGAGHAIAVVILILLPIGVQARSIKFFRKNAIYIQTICMSATVYLSLIPAITETLTRVPPFDPLASSPKAPIIQVSIFILTIAFVFGVSYQLNKFRPRKRSVKAETRELV